MITICQDCEHLHPDTAKSKPRYWLCMKFPRPPLFNPLNGDAGNPGEHYMRCEGINGGACPLFKPKRTPQKELPV